ncbi:hypothetical protein V6N13_094582 [Hibiscus sabdariffa]
MEEDARAVELGDHVKMDGFLDNKISKPQKANVQRTKETPEPKQHGKKANVQRTIKVSTTAFEDDRCWINEDSSNPL